MNRIDALFARLRASGRKAMIAYVTGGHPTLKAMDRAVRDLEKAGVSLVEVGVPFSDPIADGPTIQASSQKALAGGVTLKKLIRWAAAFRRRSSLPLVFMSYLNPIERMGAARFAREAVRAGVDGVIVPDLIPEEAGPLRAALNHCDIHLIHLAAPTTPPARQRWIARESQGFLYAVSLTGVTGARRALPADLSKFLKALRRLSPVPVAVGFGISTPDQARRVSKMADGVIVGSAIVRRIDQKKPLLPFARSLVKAVD